MALIWKNIFNLRDWFHDELIERMGEEGSRVCANFSTLTISQVEIIIETRRLTDRDGFASGVSLKELASRLKISPSACSERVDTLVNKGFLQRNPNPEDRRSILIALSKETANDFDQADNHLNNIEHNIFEKFKKDEIDQLAQLLNRFCERIETQQL